jgi:hypothetical protein
LTVLATLGGSTQSNSNRFERFTISKPPALPEVYDFSFEVLHILVVQGEAAFQGPIGYPAALLQQRADLVQYFIKGHGASSLCPAILFAVILSDRQLLLSSNQ